MDFYGYIKSTFNLFLLYGDSVNYKMDRTEIISYLWRAKCLLSKLLPVGTSGRDSLLHVLNSHEIRLGSPTPSPSIR